MVDIRRNEIHCHPLGARGYMAKDTRNTGQGHGKQQRRSSEVPTSRRPSVDSKMTKTTLSTTATSPSRTHRSVSSFSRSSESLASRRSAQSQTSARSRDSKKSTASSARSSLSRRLERNPAMDSTSSMDSAGSQGSAQRRAERLYERELLEQKKRDADERRRQREITRNSPPTEAQRGSRFQKDESQGSLTTDDIERFNRSERRQSKTLRRAATGSGDLVERSSGHRSILRDGKYNGSSKSFPSSRNMVNCQSSTSVSFSSVTVIPTDDEHVQDRRPGRYSHSIPRGRTSPSISRQDRLSPSFPGRRSPSMIVPGRLMPGRNSPSANALLQRKERLSKAYEKEPQAQNRQQQQPPTSREVSSTGNRRPPPDSYSLRELKRIGDSQRNLRADPRYARHSSRELMKEPSNRSIARSQSVRSLSNNGPPPQGRNPAYEELTRQGPSPREGSYMSNSGGSGPSVNEVTNSTPRKKHGGLKKLLGGGRKKQSDALQPLDHIQIRLATANAAFAAMDKR